MPAKYYENVLNLKARLESYEAGYAKASGYDKWMYGRRVGEYRGFVWSLKHGIHETILGVDRSSVCNCALMFPERDKHLLWHFEGHRNFNGDITTVFYYYEYKAGEEPKLMLRCQTCEVNEPAETDDENDPVAAPKHDCSNYVKPEIGVTPMECQSYNEGHRTHYKATTTLRDEERVPAAIVHIEGNSFAVTVDGVTQTMYYHQPELLIERLATAKPEDIVKVDGYDFFNINLEQGRAWFFLSSENTPCIFPMDDKEKTPQNQSETDYINFLRSHGYDHEAPAWKKWEEEKLVAFRNRITGSNTTE